MCVLFFTIIDVDLYKWLVGCIEQVILVDVLDFVVEVVADFGQGRHEAR